jgi:uncharacterized protein YcfJ
MKKVIKSISLATAITLVTATSAMAGDRYYRDHDDYRGAEKARVTHVEPIYRTVTVSSPERECWDEPQRYRGDHESYTSTIAGGIIGGVIGNQFGGGSGKTVMTIAGTLLGGSVGRDMNNSNRYREVDYRHQEQCRVVERRYQEERIDGYEVSYRYHGRHYTTVMDHDPGRFIDVDVHVEPRERRYY